MNSLYTPTLFFTHGLTEVLLSQEWDTCQELPAGRRFTQSKKFVSFTPWCHMSQLNHCIR